MKNRFKTQDYDIMEKQKVVSQRTLFETFFIVFLNMQTIYEVNIYINNF